ncbi:MAG: DUF2478 domain-containing protein [Paracoccaceae bacterium]|jgi:nucleoside-triphosphatase THEP1|nr:DUF2478 domain-containing protein [Marinovum sp.]MDG1425598.1 DUF2478 domain-containing protein [Paracoccaceae bacterium]MBT4871430.1 DUF2478 domain-containing protein [Marinovum sp.]MBT6096756.1 DUF2478 domain-containing protein [Marinovum sp.]MBT6506392.1 DUF2478 domain-containing protein [Marinovum sp.]
MKIAYTMEPSRGGIDLLLAAVATELAASGFNVCGTVQINSDREDCAGCDMDVRILPNGPTVRISQSLGKEARGCRLDPSALEMAVGHTKDSLAKGADVLIINKFGKHEAQGRGFREVIAEALSEGIPVIVGLNQLNEPAFKDFTSDVAVPLAPNIESALNWVRAATSCDG